MADKNNETSASTATSAREQAREAADRAFYAMDADPSHTAADAASDVWEPLLVEAVRVINGLADQQAMPDYWYEDFLARAKTALGNGS